VTRQHPHTEVGIVLHLAHNLGRVAHREVAFLQASVLAKLGLGLGSWGIEGRTEAWGAYPVEEQLDGTAGVDGRLFAAQLRHLAQDADGLVLEVGEVFGGDARGLREVAHRCGRSGSFDSRVRRAYQGNGEGNSVAGGGVGGWIGVRVGFEVGGLSRWTLMSVGARNASHASTMTRAT
jgi:hypothetical protein